MSLIQDSMPAMQSAYHLHPSAACDESSRRRILQAVFWLSRGWVERLRVDDPQRQTLIYLGMLSDDLVRAGDYSSKAMTTAQALLCVNCRSLNAAQGRCAGQPLDRCQLLKEVFQ